MANEIPSTDNTPTSVPPPQRGSNATRIILALVIVALSTALVYFIVKSNQTEQAKVQVEAKNEQLEAEIKELDTKVSKMEGELKDQDIQLDEKDRRVTELNTALSQAKARIQQLIAAGKLQADQAEKYQYRVDQMQYYMKKYEDQLNELKTQNEKLSKENQQLNAQVKAKSTEAEQINREKDLYKTKLEAASILKAASFTYTSVNRRGKESAAERNSELRESRTDIVKTCFKLLDNEVAAPGQRQVYLVIKAPDGSILKAPEASATFIHNGQERPYSAKIAVAYNRQVLDVCMAYPKPEGSTLAKGTYTLQVFTDGFEVGGSNFSIK